MEQSGTQWNKAEHNGTQWKQRNTAAYGDLHFTNILTLVPEQYNSKINTITTTTTTTKQTILHTELCEETGNEICARTELMEGHHYVRKTEINWGGLLKNKNKTEKTYVFEKEHSDIQ